MPPQLEPLLEGLVFPEGPRWHEGALFFSDMHDHRVVRVDLAGRSETVVEVPHRPSGLGWLPDGRMLVVSMTDRRLLRLDAGRLVEVADLSPVASWHCNDMVVDRAGRAYVGNFGFDLEAGAAPAPAHLARVTPEGDVRVAAPELRFPNGTVITEDGRFYVEQQQVAREDLLSTLRAVRGDRNTLVLRADRKATVDQFAYVASAAKALGMTILMATERPDVSPRR